MGGWGRRLVLGLAIAAAAAALWIWSGRGARDAALEAPLLDLAPADLAAVEVRRLAGTSRLARDGDRWRLTGAGADLVDSARVAPLLRSLAAATAGPEIPGASRDDARFGFADYDALELLLLRRDGATTQLGLGALNPVTGHVYARGAGRDGVFPVAPRLREVWAAFPDAVRLRTLLPHVAAAQVDTVRIAARGAAWSLLVARAEGRWWLAEPPGGAAALGPRVARYHGLYQDRRRRDAAGGWLLADDRALAGLVYEVGESVVEGFAAVGTEEAVAAEVGLSPPYRTVELVRHDGPAHRLEFGEAQDDQRVWVRRGTAVVVAPATALRTLEQPFSEFVDLGAFSFRFGAADSFEIDGLLRGRADPDSAGGWLVLGRENPRRSLRFVLIDTQMALDALPALEVLPPSARDPLQARERYTLTAWLPWGRRHDLALGWLPDGRAAAWEAADGKVVVVPEEIVVSLRAVRNTVPPAP